MGVLGVAALFGFIGLALALISTLGPVLGAVVWLMAYAVFLGLCRAIVRHVDPPYERTSVSHRVNP